jgi:hypothetical protein
MAGITSKRSLISALSSFPDESDLLVKPPHFTGETLERYAMKRLAEPEVGRLESHILTCPSCRERLNEHIEFVRAMKAAAKFKSSGKRAN